MFVTRKHVCADLEVERKKLQRLFDGADRFMIVDNDLALFAHNQVKRTTNCIAANL